MAIAQLSAVMALLGSDTALLPFLKSQKFVATKFILPSVLWSSRHRLINEQVLSFRYQVFL
jgi:hypothetical protein